MHGMFGLVMDAEIGEIRACIKENRSKSIWHSIWASVSCLSGHDHTGRLIHGCDECFLSWCHPQLGIHKQYYSIHCSGTWPSTTLPGGHIHKCPPTCVTHECTQNTHSRIYHMDWTIQLDDHCASGMELSVKCRIVFLFWMVLTRLRPQSKPVVSTEVKTPDPMCDTKQEETPEPSAPKWNDGFWIIKMRWTCNNIRI